MTMKLFLVAATALSTASTAAAAFCPSTFGVRARTTVVARMAEYDLNYGKKNAYESAKTHDGGQGTFGAVSPNDWRVPGTSPEGQSSYAGAPDGGEEPWFAEAISTVSLDLKKADDTLKAFTKEAANFKIETFGEKKPHGWTSNEKALDELVGSMGYSKFLESTDKQIAKAWDSLHPDPNAKSTDDAKKSEKKEQKKEEKSADDKKEENKEE